MRALVIVVAIGCGGGTQVEPISNTAKTTETVAPPPRTPSPTFAVEVIAGKTQPGMGVMQGRITDTLTEPIVGATIVISSPSLTGEMVAISDEKGRFTLSPLPVGTYEVTIYYGELQFVHAVPVRAGKVVLVRVRGWPADYQGEAEIRR